jgi:hypothetical protein
MTKIAVILGAILLLAGVATAGTVTGLGSSDDSPTVSVPALSTTTDDVRQEDRREKELRGRENEPGEDVRGPCDELEHANDLRCTGVQTLDNDDEPGEHRGRGRGGDDDDGRGNDRSGPSENSGPGSNDSGGGGHSGRRGDDD